MVKMRYILLLTLILALIIPLAAADSTQNDCIYYFHGEKCEDCQTSNKIIQTLEANYPNLNVTRFDVHKRPDHYNLLQEHFSAYNVKPDVRGIPAVFIGQAYMIGSSSIQSFLEQQIQSNLGPNCPTTKPVTAVGMVGEKSSANVLTTLTFPSVTASSLKNIFNPGIIALLLILFALLSLVKEREDLVKKGLLYLFGIYIANLLFSLGMFSFMNTPQLDLFFYKTVGFLAILFGLAGMRNFFGVWNSALKSLPDSVAEKCDKVFCFIHTPLGTFLLGFLAALFTVANSSSTILLVRELFTQGFMQGVIAPILFYYHAIYLLVFVGLILLANFVLKTLNDYAAVEQKKDDKTQSRWKKHNMKILAFFLRFIILVLGIVLLFV